MRNNLRFIFLFCLSICFCFTRCSNSVKYEKPAIQEELSIPSKSARGVGEISQEDVVKTEIQEKQKAEVKKDNIEGTLQKPLENKPQVKASKKEPTPANNLKPKITFEETMYDFEEITAGDIIEIKFNFKNTGKAPLIIKSATATCGCTVPSYPFIPIEPGERGFIGVTYNSVGKSGEQKPSITIITNAAPAKYVLHLQGNVLEKKKQD
jgi:hypothetical protein